MLEAEGSRKKRSAGPMGDKSWAGWADTREKLKKEVASALIPAM
jgi:hypothetical protein